MPLLLAILLVTSSAVLATTPAVAASDVVDHFDSPAHSDRIERPSENAWSSVDENESVSDKDLAALPQAFVQAARLGELGTACKWGANQDERATARERLLGAAAAIARRVGVSPTHAQLLIEAFSSDADILTPIQADVAHSVQEKHVCDDDALRETWEASAFLGSKRI